MDIYREDHAGKLNAFLLADTSTPGKRRSILSSLPLYTLDSDYLKDFLQKHRLLQRIRLPFLTLHKISVISPKKFWNMM